MSSMLEQAIVDAKALKEAAIKNAETAIIDKYQEEVRTAMDALLEQEGDEFDLGLEDEPELDTGTEDMALGEDEGGMELSVDAPDASDKKWKWMNQTRVDKISLSDSIVD